MSDDRYDELREDAERYEEREHERRDAQQRPREAPEGTAAEGARGGAEGELGGRGLGARRHDEVGDGDVDDDEPLPERDVPRSAWPSRAKGRRRRRQRGEILAERPKLTPQQRLLILDTWMRSKLPATDFAPMVGVTASTLYSWKKRFEEEGPAGLVHHKRGKHATSSRLPEPTRRAILMLKQAHPAWGQDRIHDVLARTEGYGASPGAIGRVLSEAGYVVEDEPTRPHAPRVRRFERARPNELWQTDIFTFTLKREGRRVHMVAFMDDYSRFIVGFGVHASASGALVREVFEAGIANFGAPREVLTDNGAQYHTWRGKSAFKKLCERRGIHQIVASPRRPQTLGKVERFWGSLWRECVEEALFLGLEDARRRIALFIDHYNFQRPHQGIAGLVPADRFFEAADEVRKTLAARVAANALELARNGVPRKPFYLTGRVGRLPISMHAEGDHVVVVHPNGEREEVDLKAPGMRMEEGDSDVLPEAVAPNAAPPDADGVGEEERELPAPGTSELDALLDRLEAGLAGDDEGPDVNGGES